MRELTEQEVEQVSGGLDWGDGGTAVIAIGFVGGPATALFGMAVGGAMLYMDYKLQQ